MESGKGWKWYGFAGHLCVAKRCAFHLCTAYGDKLVSTVGAYYPKGSDKMETIGSGSDAFYETFIWDYSGDDKDGNPILGGDPVETIRYADSNSAEQGHYKFCDKYLKDKDLTA